MRLAASRNGKSYCGVCGAGWLPEPVLSGAGVGVGGGVCGWFVLLLVSFVMLPLIAPLSADPRMLIPLSSLVEVDTEDDELLPVSMLVSEPVAPWSLHPASIKAAAKIISSFFIASLGYVALCNCPLTFNRWASAAMGESRVSGGELTYLAVRRATPQLTCDQTRA